MNVFKTGNIYRMYIKDFLTYDEIEFKPKAHLNIVIGPNGTGKSTILCALCIVLGGKPSITGRGKEIGEYVKHEKNVAVLEVEIFVEGEGENVLVKRKFDRANKSQFYLQGKEATKKQVDVCIAKLNIQIDNLCQFLPQDRVVDFAKMNKFQLLENTEKSVGDLSIFEQHEILKGSGQELKVLQSKLIDLEQQLNDAVEKNARLEDVVKNHAEKRNLDFKINKLETQRLWFLYDKNRLVHQNKKEQRDEEMRALEKAKKELCPTQEKIQKIEKYYQKQKSQAFDKSTALKFHYGKSTDIEKKYSDIEETIQDSKIDFVARQREENQRKKTLTEYKAQLDQITQQLENLQNIDEAALQQDTSVLTNKIQKASQELVGLQHQRDEAVMTKKAEEAQARKLSMDLKACQDISQRRLMILQQFNKDAYEATLWLEKNRDKFSGTIYLPMCTLLNITQINFAKYVEDIISRNDLMAFVADDRDDMNVFKQAMDKQRIRVNIVNSNSTNLELYQPDIPIEKLRKLGFDCYMKDLIDAPNEVIGYICRNYNIHKIPIAQAGNFDSVPNNIRRFYMNNKCCFKKVSRYDGVVSTSIAPVREAQFLKISVDNARVQDLEMKIKNSIECISQCDTKLNSFKEEEDKLTNLLETWRTKKRYNIGLNEQRKQLKIRLSAKENQIRMNEREAFDLDKGKVLMKNKIQNAVKELVTVTVDRGNAVTASGKAAELVVQLVTECKILKDKMLSLESELKESEAKLIHLENAILKKSKEVETLKVEATISLNKLVQNLGLRSHREISEKTRKELLNSSLQNLEDVELKLNEFEAIRDCLVVADDNVVKEYQNRESLIKELRENYETARKIIENHGQKLAESRTKWLPRVNSLVDDLSEQFSKFMARMGCSGEVVLDAGENENDFSKYGFIIRVRFRDGEKLRELTAQHQSGGERAVSTSLYLLALQSLTKVPFRCVDEINQGMDPTNERRMFNMLMEICSQVDTSQYFLVTPKLLMNLNYNEYVNFLIVYNSPTILPHSKMILSLILRKKEHLKNKKQKVK